MRDMITDGALGAGAVTSPRWLQLINLGASERMVFGGLALIGPRIALAVHQWRHRHHDGGQAA